MCSTRCFPPGRRVPLLGYAGVLMGGSLVAGVEVGCFFDR